MPPFEQAEIDGLVDEVEEVETPHPATAAHEGVWMGAPDDEGTSYGAPVAATEIVDEAPPAPKTEFQVDRNFDPEWAQSTPPPAYAETFDAPARPRATAPAAAPVPIEMTPIDAPTSSITLTEVASDDDLFTDPSLEVARLSDGEAREIIVPVMLGDGPSARRYKLAIRLRFDAVD